MNNFSDNFSHTLQKAYFDILEHYDEGYEPVTPFSEFIEGVLRGSHKTYKYILVTALIAKATDPSKNALSLQAQSSLEGAYDARSVCHKYVVPFDRNMLNGALGGSNEPFLNKPARFPQLSKDNAVRRGADREILHSLCDNLPLIDTSEEAYFALQFAIKILLDIQQENNKAKSFELDLNLLTVANLLHFVDSALEYNCEGEMMTLIVGAAYMCFAANDKATKIELHPVNQSGSSSREVSDLDVYLNGNKYIGNELKDKNFSREDVFHAVHKVISSGHNQLNFIVGRHGKYKVTEISEYIEDCSNRGFILNVISVDLFLRSLFMLSGDFDTEYFIRSVFKSADIINAKLGTLEVVRELCESIFGAEFFLKDFK